MTRRTTFPTEHRERAQRESHASGAGRRAPASEREGGSGGAKPPGKIKTITRRELLGTMGTMAVVVTASPLIDGFAVSAQALPLAAVAGPDRVVMRHGKTYLNGWAGYGAPPRRGRRGRGTPPPTPAPDPGPAPTTTWSKVSGPGSVTFADPKAAVTTATFSAPGEYVLKVTADNGKANASSTLTVKAELPPPATPLIADRDEELHDHEPAVVGASEGADCVVDPALHRPDQPRRSAAGARRHRQLHRSGEGAARRAARSRTRATCSPTPGSTRPSRR